MRRDFIHKQSIILKELRESFINMKIIELNYIYIEEVKVIDNKNQINNHKLYFLKTCLTNELMRSIDLYISSRNLFKIDLIRLIF